MSSSGPSEPGTRWALIGASDIAATRIIPAIRAHGGHISVVQSSSPDWAPVYAENHGIDDWTCSVEEAVVRSDIDAVYVSSHNANHHLQVIAAARAGKHVLVEKPLALSVEDAKAMVTACQKAGVVIATNHHLPSAPSHMAMKEIVEWSGNVIVQTHDAYDNYHLPTSLDILGDSGAIRSVNSMTGDPVGQVTLHHRSVASPFAIGVRDDLYLSTICAFDAAINDGVEPRVTGLDGVRSLAAAIAALEALQTGCVVHVEQIP